MLVFCRETAVSLAFSGTFRFRFGIVSASLFRHENFDNGYRSFFLGILRIQASTVDVEDRKITKFVMA